MRKNERNSYWLIDIDGVLAFNAQFNFVGQGQGSRYQFAVDRLAKYIVIKSRKEMVNSIMLLPGSNRITLIDDIINNILTNSFLFTSAAIEDLKEKINLIIKKYKISNLRVQAKTIDFLVADNKLSANILDKNKSLRFKISQNDKFLKYIMEQFYKFCRHNSYNINDYIRKIRPSRELGLLWSVFCEAFLTDQSNFLQDFFLNISPLQIKNELTKIISPYFSQKSKYYGGKWPLYVAIMDALRKKNYNVDSLSYGAYFHVVDDNIGKLSVITRRGLQQLNYNGHKVSRISVENSEKSAKYCKYLIDQSVTDNSKITLLDIHKIKKGARMWYSGIHYNFFGVFRGKRFYRKPSNESYTFHDKIKKLSYQELYRKVISSENEEDIVNVIELIRDRATEAAGDTSRLLCHIQDQYSTKEEFAEKFRIQVEQKWLGLRYDTFKVM